jgi:polyisoprenyl-phosphate glycosyltransferase
MPTNRDNGTARLTIVVPCYNEELVVDECAKRLGACLTALVGAGKAAPGSQILFVDDGSTDRTWELIDALCARDKMFSGLSLSRNFGHQGALLAGLHHAPGDAVISIDADLQDDVAAIERMVDRYREGFDVVYGVRRERKRDTAFKRLTALGFYRLMNLLGARTIHNHADFRLMSRQALDALRDFRETNLFLRGIVPLIGFPATQVFYDRVERIAGQTKYPFRKMFALSLAAITSFSTVPLRLITATALGGFLVLIGITIWALWIRLFTTRGLPGWASVILPLLFIGSLNMLALGVLGEYVARIFDEIKARPRYLVQETRNLPRTTPVS